MLKVLDILPVGSMLSLTLEGDCSKISNGSQLIDNLGNKIKVISVAMTRYENPSDISKYTTVLVDFCKIEKGCELSV